MKKTGVILTVALLALLLIWTVFSITPRRPRAGWRSEAEILALVDNTTDKEKLITQSYKFNKKTKNYIFMPMWFLGSAYGWEQSVLGTPDLYSFQLAELDKYIEIQCLRQPDPEHLYAVFRDNKGNWYYALFLYYEDGQNSHWYVWEVWYPYKKMYKSDFEKLRSGSSTVKDVKKIDPYADFQWYGKSGHIQLNADKYAGETTINSTWDGYTVKIFYSKTDKTVAEVRFSQNEAYALHTYLLPIDLPE